jgi:hypothetical protein
MFPALRSLFKTAFKILNRNVCHNFFHISFNVLNVRETLSFQLTGNSQKSARAKSGEHGGWSIAEMPFPAKNCDTRNEEYPGALS